MATELTAGSEAVLALAREFRHAVSTRQEVLQNALHAYDRAAGNRCDQAANFLRIVQRADRAYESSSQEALKCFRERLDQHHGDSTPGL
jgi:uncharacterized Ntn-hydrolase superfamily protein